jgi:hypothetical protein
MSAAELLEFEFQLLTQPPRSDSSRNELRDSVGPNDLVGKQHIISGASDLQVESKRMMEKKNENNHRGFGHRKARPASAQA